MTSHTASDELRTEMVFEELHDTHPLPAFRRLVTFCLSAPCTSTLTYLLARSLTHFINHLGKNNDIFITSSRLTEVPVIVISNEKSSTYIDKQPNWSFRHSDRQNTYNELRLMCPDSLLRLWHYINHYSVTYLLNDIDNELMILTVKLMINDKTGADLVAFIDTTVSSNEDTCNASMTIASSSV